MAQLVSGPDFTELFRRFHYTAWRLEPRRRYNVESETAAFGRFMAGDDPGLEWIADWLDLMREQTGHGKRIERVRVIDDPPSDYLQFMLWLHPHNADAGEDIRYLDRAAAAKAGLPDYDYWLFDSQLVARIEFDADDRPLGAHLIDDPAEVVRHNHWRDVAWHYAELCETVIGRA